MNAYRNSWENGCCDYNYFYSLTVYNDLDDIHGELSAELFNGQICDEL